MIEIHIPTLPTSWAASRVCRKIHYNPKHKEKTAIQNFIKATYKDEMITLPVEISMQFIFEPPKSASKRKQKDMLAGKLIPLSKDCTNMQKFFEDCLKKIVIDDDRFVAKISSQKLYGLCNKVIIKLSLYVGDQ